MSSKCEKRRYGHSFLLLSHSEKLSCLVSSQTTRNTHTQNKCSYKNSATHPAYKVALLKSRACNATDTHSWLIKLYVSTHATLLYLHSMESYWLKLFKGLSSSSSYTSMNHHQSFHISIELTVCVKMKILALYKQHILIPQNVLLKTPSVQLFFDGTYILLSQSVQVTSTAYNCHCALQ